MKALLLAAGKATRLGDLSRVSPKCLHKVGGLALIDRLVGQLSAAGVEEFLINTHHLAEQVFDHVSVATWGERATVVYEDSLLGTLGTLRANADFLASDGGWVLHADNYISGSLQHMRTAFERRAESTWGAMLTFNVADPSSFGVATVDSRGLVTAFDEKAANAVSRTASAATFLLDRRAVGLARSLPAQSSDLSRDLIPRLLNRLLAVPAGGEVIDIGTPEGLRAARALAASEVALSLLGDQPKHGSAEPVVHPESDTQGD